jgi:DnaA N-terminal domain/Initiator Replication protein, WH1/Initiator Rep protein, WH2
MTDSPVPAAHTNDLLKHTAAIHISNTLTLLQRKASNVLLKHAFSRLSEDTTHVLSLATIAQELGWAENSNFNDDLHGALRTLNTTQIEWNILGKDKRKKVWGITTILSGAEITEGKIHYRYDKSLRELLASPTIYARLDMDVQKSFRSKHSLALWEFFVEALCSSGEREIDTAHTDLAQLRKFLAASEEYYDDFKKLNQKIIKPALKEINNVSDLHVTVDYKKDKKRVIALAFHIKRKDGHQLSLGLDSQERPTESFQSPRHILCEEFGISPKQASALIKKYASEELENALACVREQKKHGKIENLAAYTISAIKGGWQLPAAQIGTTETVDIDEQETDIKPTEWKEVRAIVRRELGDATFRSWIAPLACTSLSTDSVRLEAPTQFFRGWIQSHYADILTRAWTRFYDHPMQVSIDLDVQKVTRKAA